MFIVVAALLALAALASSAQADAAFYKGKGKDDRRVKIYMLAGEKAVEFFLPRNFKVRFDDKDRTSRRFPGDDKLNTTALPLELRPNGRRRFVQHFRGEKENGTKIKIGIVGSFNPSRTRARGWFKFRVVLGKGESPDLPEGTRGASNRIRWLVRKG